MIPASPKLRVKRVEDLCIQRRDLHLTDQWTDVLTHVTAVQLQRPRRSVELVQVAVEQLVDRGRSARASPLLHLAYQPVSNGAGLPLRLRPCRDDFGEVVPTLAHRVDPGVHADSQRAAGQRIDAAAFTPRLIFLCTHHGVERNQLASPVTSRHKTD